MLKILLVEDNADNRDMLVRRLSKRGYAVVCAVDGAAAAQLARSEQPNLILMDIELPDLDGREVTRRLKADPDTGATPVIGLSAWAMPADRNRALEAGCDEYETKPIDLPRLLEKIRALTERPVAP